jgi:cobalamin biosynthesis Mg chelatase CobN
MMKNISYEDMENQGFEDIFLSRTTTNSSSKENNKDKKDNNNETSSREVELDSHQENPNVKAIFLIIFYCVGVSFLVAGIYFCISMAF